MKRYNTRSVNKHESMGEELGDDKHIAIDVPVQQVEEAGGDGKVGQKRGYGGKSKRSLSFSEPVKASLKQEPRHSSNKRSSSETVSKRPQQLRESSSPIETQLSAKDASPETSQSPLAYFGFSDKEPAVSGQNRFGASQVNRAVLGTPGSVVVKQSMLKEVVFPSDFAVSSLLEPEALSLAIDHLKAVDERLRLVIENHEGPKFQKCGNYFLSLARSIVYQQLATKAATAIYGRVEALCGGGDFVTPQAIAKLSAGELRTVGISERKASYLHDLARHFTSGVLSDLAISNMDDDSLMTALTTVRGIGVWSVHMFMMFSLHRPDVLPVGDLGVRKGFQKLFQLRALPVDSQMEELASKWRPFRSLGSWYMWRV